MSNFIFLLLQPHPNLFRMVILFEIVRAGDGSAIVSAYKAIKAGLTGKPVKL